MEKCIYTKQMFEIPEGKKYPQEHIIPAGLGGIKMLPENYVSIEANNSFSTFEREVMKKGIISFFRSFVGPGKRGKQNQNIKYQSKSIIHLMENPNTKELELGFLAKGLPYPIFQMFIDNFDEVKIKKNEFSLHGVQGTQEKNNKILKEMIEAKQTPEYFNYVQITNKMFPKKKVIFGCFEKRIYLAIGSDLTKEDVSDWLVSIKFENANKGSEIFKYQPKCSMRLESNLSSLARICAKTAFNLLADKKGKEFVLNSKFDEIRNFILYGHGKFNDFWGFTNLKEFCPNFLKGYNRHFIIIDCIEKELNAAVSFYGIIFHVTLAKNCDFKFSESMICFWEEKKEMTIEQFFKSKGDNYIYISDPLGKFKDLTLPGLRG